MNVSKPPQSDGADGGKRRFYEELWEIDISSLSRLKRLGVSFMRIIVLVLRGFRENECPLHATALTYYSLMALVPILALATAIVRRLGMGAVTEEKIAEIADLLPGQIKETIFRILDQLRIADFTALGAIGLVLLVWVVIQVLSRIEMSFNRVWGIAAPRRFGRKLADYLSVIIVVPVLLAAAGAFNISLLSHSIADLIRTRIGPEYFIYARAFSVLPLIATWVAFVFLYTVMTGTQVAPVSVTLGSMLGGALWFFWQSLYFKVQIGISQFNAVYAAFASIPVFLLWLYVSWQLVLLGAEICFALQNYSTYKMEQRAHGASPQSKIMLALSVICHAAQPMLINGPCFRVADYARLHRVPVRLINEVVAELAKAGLLAEVAGGEGQYVLLKTPGAVHVQDVVNAVLRSGASPKSLGLERLNPAVRHVLGKMDAGVAGVLANFSITDLLQLHARLEQTPHSQTASRPGENI